ncbi:hypothetical protein [Nocardia sp. NPDC004123]
MEEFDVALAVRAAEAATGVIRDQFRGPVIRYGKEDDFVPGLISPPSGPFSILRAARPGDRFLAGESGTTGDPSDRTWLIIRCAAQGISLREHRLPG